MKARLLLACESPVMRSMVRVAVAAMPEVTVAAEAADAHEMRRLAALLRPDVVLADASMRELDPHLLRRLAEEQPLHVVEIEKPLIADQAQMADFIQALGRELRSALRARAQSAALAPRGPLVLLGASTGGTQAVRTVLAALPRETGPVLIAQHMPAGFTASFAERLDGASALRVHEAVDGERLLPGHAYLSPGDAHLRIAAAQGGYRAKLGYDAPVNRHRPAVDALFASAALLTGEPRIAVLLTGMGVDGAGGLLQLRQSGAYTIAQDEETSLVFGMPKAAIDLGAACETCSLDRIAERIRVIAARLPERQG